MKKFQEEKKENSERWLLTYSDLITLLMIFFVVMYASSNVDKDKYEKLSQSLSSVLNGSSAIIDTTQNPIIPEGNIEHSSSESLNSMNVGNIDNFKQEVDKIIKDSGLTADISTRVEERGLIISLSDSILFESGKADVKEETLASLENIAALLKRLDNNVSIEGHTDNVPITNSEFHSNWQLSAIRAANICEYLSYWYGIEPERLSSRGYSEYSPIGDNSTEEGRSKNRRVEIAIISW